MNISILRHIEKLVSQLAFVLRMLYQIGITTTKRKSQPVFIFDSPFVTNIPFQIMTTKYFELFKDAILWFLCEINEKLILDDNLYFIKEAHLFIFIFGTLKLVQN